MAKKKPSKFGVARRDPLLTGLPGLDFETIETAEVIELTPEQKATAFLTRYLETERPISRYHSYFEASVKGEAWELKELKNFYGKLVATEKWTEEKFISVVNSIYRDNQVMSAVVLDARGRMFDNGAFKEPEKRGNSRRRGRI